MPSTFDADFAEHASPDLFDTFGEAITYCGANGSEESITAMVERQGATIENRANHVVEIDRVSVQMESPSGLTRGAWVRVDDLVYSFESSRGTSGWITTAVFARPVIKETTAPADV